VWRQQRDTCGDFLDRFLSLAGWAGIIALVIALQ
jgi:hypothetical protein